MNGRDLLQRADRVTLELSNLCNYARLHPECPAHHVRTPRSLSTALVHDVLDTLGRFGFSTGKYLAFHLYNEPLLDPRLLSFVQRARTNCHDISVILWTNGWHMLPRNAMDLIRSVFTNFMVSAYSDEEFDRLFNLGVWLRETLAAQPPPAGLAVYFRVRRSHTLDGRMRASVPVSAGDYEPCSQPWSDLIIRASGSIGLCCYDWGEQKTFGNLNGTRFEDCLAGCRRELDTLQDELSAGIRTLPVCQACQFPRWPAGKDAERLQDPIDEAELAGIMGKSPVESEIVMENHDPRYGRMVALFEGD